MTNLGLGDPSAGPDAFRIDDHVLRALRDGLPSVASQTLVAVDRGGAGLPGAFRGPMGENIEAPCRWPSEASSSWPAARATWIPARRGGRRWRARTPWAAARRGPAARMDALLAAYRVGARVSWRDWPATAAEAGLPAAAMAEFAELMFAYIDELSAASVAGYADELHTVGGPRSATWNAWATAAGRRRPGRAGGAAERAEWPPPGSLTAVLLPAAQVHGVLGLVSPDTCWSPRNCPARTAGSSSSRRGAARARHGRGRPATSAAAARPTAGRGRSARAWDSGLRLVRPRGADGGRRRCSPGRRPNRSTPRTTSSIWC